MFESQNRAVFDMLNEHGLVSTAESEALQNEHQTTGKPVADLAIELGLVGEKVLKHWQRWEADFAITRSVCSGPVNQQ